MGVDKLETTCFVCGSTNTYKGKCIDCGYEFPFKFPCPLHNGSISCRHTKKVCNKRFNYEDCEIYHNYG